MYVPNSDDHDVSFSEMSAPGGKLEEALEQYKRSKIHGIQRADMHIRNVSTLRYPHNCLAHNYLACLGWCQDPRPNGKGWEGREARLITYIRSLRTWT